MGIMQLSNVVSATNVKFNNSTASTKTYLPAQKPDTFELKEFNIEDTMSELKQMKGLGSKPKFTEERLSFIKEELTKNPGKWEPFRGLIQNPKVIGSIACDFLKKDIDELKIISDISKIKKDDNTLKFSALDLKNISNSLSGKQIEKFKELAKCNLGIDNLIELSKNEKFKNTQKATIKISEMEACCNHHGNGFFDMQLKPDEYDKDAFSITVTTANGKRIELLDSNLNRMAIEEDKNITKDGKQYIIKKNVDYRNNTTSKVVLECDKKLPQPILLNEIRIVKDKYGNKVRTEYTSQSEVPGVLNIKHVFPDGSEKIISSGKIDSKTGVTSVKKHMTSTDGTTTDYLYEDDPQGNRISDYKITDKNGNVLLNNSLSFEVINDKKFISSKNKEKYEITLQDKSIQIKDTNKNETSTINFANYIDGNVEKILEVLKKMPGEELIALAKNTRELQGIDNILYSTYAAVEKRIKTGDNLFVMLHELGHAKDYGEVNVKEKETLSKSIFNNKKVNEVFEKEKAEFNKAFPDAQRNHIQYFIKESEHKDGIQEAIAESNALLGTYNNDDLFAIRSQYLQQYFPKTIATLAKELNK